MTERVDLGKRGAMRVAVLASGRGSNLQALCEAFPPGNPLVEVALVLSNRQGCGALQKAQARGCEVAVFPLARYGSRVAQQAAMTALLCERSIALVVLAGYDQIIESSLLSAFAQRVINIHPSLLPAFAGTLHAQQAAIAHGVKVSGCTVHFVDDQVDCGPIIAQAAVPVLDGDSAETLSARILEKEHLLLPRVVRLFAEERVRVSGRHVWVIEAQQ